MLTILYLLVNTITFILAMGRTYKFANGMTIPYLTYMTDDHMDIFVAKSYAIFKVNSLTCNISMDTST